MLGPAAGNRVGRGARRPEDSTAARRPRTAASATSPPRRPRGSRLPCPGHVRPRALLRPPPPRLPSTSAPASPGPPRCSPGFLAWCPAPPAPALPAAQSARLTPRSSPGAALSRGRTCGRRGLAGLRPRGGGLGCITWSRRAGAGLAKTETLGGGRRGGQRREGVFAQVPDDGRGATRSRPSARGTAPGTQLG